MGRLVQLNKLFLLSILSLGLLVGGSTQSVEAETHSCQCKLADIIEPLLPTVVNISTSGEVASERPPVNLPDLPQGHPFRDLLRRFLEEYQQPKKVTSLGSGFIIDPKGYIVTADHIIAGADEVRVTLNDKKNTEFKAKIIGRDPRTDLAVLKVASKTPLPFVKWGESQKSRVGDQVIVIGNPFGLSSTVTAGIISNIARDISARGRGVITADYIDGYIQADASINMGNSGGPMFNIAGQVIGINSVIATPSGGSVGLGFAIPSSLAKKVVDQIIKFGRTRRGWLGVNVQNVSEEIAKALGLKKAQGVLVGNIISDSPASKAGLKTKDVILELNGVPITDLEMFPRLTGEIEINKEVPITIWRDGKKTILKVKIGEYEEAEEAGLIKSQDSRPDKGLKIDALGLSLATLTPLLKEKFDLHSETEGVVVTGIHGDKAHKSGLQPGDVLIEVYDRKVKTAQEVDAQVKKALQDKKNRVLVFVARGNTQRFLTLSLEDTKNSKKP